METTVYIKLVAILQLFSIRFWLRNTDFDVAKNGEIESLKNTIPCVKWVCCSSTVSTKTYLQYKAFMCTSHSHYNAKKSPVSRQMLQSKYPQRQLTKNALRTQLHTVLGTRLVLFFYFMSYMLYCNSANLEAHFHFWIFRILELCINEVKSNALLYLSKKWCYFHRQRSIL